MSRYVTQESPGYLRRLLTTAASILGLMVLGAPSALAAPGGPQLAVSGSTPTAVSLTATGFARQSTVEFTVTVGGCTGRSSVGASTDTLVAQFVTTPTCTGPATATATAGTQTASVSFAFTPPGPVGGTQTQTNGGAGPTNGGAGPPRRWSGPPRRWSGSGFRRPGPGG